MSKTVGILVRISPDQRDEYRALARRETEGNVSLLIRKAMDAYQRQHALVDVTTAYEIETQYGTIIKE